MRITLRYSLALLINLMSIGTSAQMKFYASISPGVIHKNEIATYRLVIENSAELLHVDPPSFTDFILLSGPKEESGKIRNSGTLKNFTGFVLIVLFKRVASAGGKM